MIFLDETLLYALCRIEEFTLSYRRMDLNVCIRYGNLFSYTCQLKKFTEL